MCVVSVQADAPTPQLTGEKSLDLKGMPQLVGL